MILTNCLQGFQSTGIFETGLSDFQKLTFTVLKQYYLKEKPNVVFHRKYKNFRNDLFRSELENELCNYDLNNMESTIFLRTFPNDTHRENYVLFDSVHEWLVGCF